MVCRLSLTEVYKKNQEIKTKAQEEDKRRKEYMIKYGKYQEKKIRKEKEEAEKEDRKKQIKKLKKYLVINND